MTDAPWQVAEKIAESHLQTLGFFRVRRTRAGADGGLDVIGQGIAAQVKLLRAAVGSPDVQRLRGAAHRYEHAVFYAHRSSGYSGSAIRIADDAEVALFVYDLDGSIDALNSFAAELESPLTSVLRAFTQSSVARVRWQAVKVITDRFAGELKPRLLAIQEQLTAAIAQLSEDLRFEELPAEVRDLSAEAGRLRVFHEQYFPQMAFERVGLAIRQLAELSERLEHESFESLVHSEWRSGLTNCVGELHDAVDALTTAAIAWVGVEVIEELRCIVTSIVDDPDVDVTEEQVLEGWPNLPPFGVEPDAQGAI